MKQFQILRVVVASPSDLQPERNSLNEVAAELNQGIAKDYALHIEISRWETDVFPGFHIEGPQGLIDQVLAIEDCDLLIGIFWKRFGTPTLDAKSGTEHEIRTAYKAWKLKKRPQLMIYFKERPYSPKTKAETDQWGQVLEFKREFPPEGLWWAFTGKLQFEKLLRNHLTLFIRTISNKITITPTHKSPPNIQTALDTKEEWQARTPPSPLYTHQIELPQVDDILAGQIAASTSAMYRRDIAAYVKFARKEGLAEDNSKTLDAWRDYLVSGYVQRNGKQLSPNSINRMLAPLRKLFKEAARLDMVKEEVAAKFKAVPGVKKKTLKERLKSHSRTRISPEDMRRLCESPNTDTLVGLRDRALLATLASSGVRASELTSLTLDQIIKKDGGYQLSVRGKTDTDYRDAAISPEAYQLIQAWLQARSCASMYVFTAFAGRGDRQLDTPITESGLWKLVVKYAKKCGIPWVKPHDIRRFVGTQLTATGDLRKAQIALGHKDISSTARHYRLDELPVGITDNLY